MFPIGVFTSFNCELVTTQNIFIVGVQQIDESIDGVRETSKLGEIPLISYFPIGVFTWFNCELVTIQDILIGGVRQIDESTNGVRETSKPCGLNRIHGPSHIF